MHIDDTDRRLLATSGIGPDDLLGEALADGAHPFLIFRNQCFQRLGGDIGSDSHFALQRKLRRQSVDDDKRRDRNRNECK